MNRYLWPIAVLLLVGVLVLGGSAALAQAPAPVPAAAYVVEQAQAAGGGYRLAAGTWQARGVAGSSGYQLSSVILQGSGCCCTFLPCLFRGAP